MKIRILFSVAALLVCAALTTAAYAQSAHAPRSNASSTAIITFGQEGGNIAPFAISIGSEGTVRAASVATYVKFTPTLSKTAVAALEKLTRAEGVAKLQPITVCSHTLPDIAARFIAMHVGSTDFRVAVRGGCLQNFNALFAVLMAAVHAAL